MTQTRTRTRLQDYDLKQLITTLSTSKHTAFKAICRGSGRSMNNVVEEMIDGVLADAKKNGIRVTVNKGAKRGDAT